MEIICIEKKIFDELVVRFCEVEKKISRLCRPSKDAGLKNWIDNQEACEILRVSKRTLQVYRDKGLLPFARIKHKMFYKPEDIRHLLESSYHPQKNMTL
ncbi:helix-turn-helix domain-containing protein [Bacteroides gallinarum]|uniref:helix-turn-helix domain-containing protein n=1 Tax=Bacteroides gallinarum TaxID=376806 RepID=UPI00035F90AB|nr:helix-turn-helix domain-containing protein [Bacteroides gallinarum]